MPSTGAVAGRESFIDFERRLLCHRAIDAVPNEALGLVLDGIAALLAPYVTANVEVLYGPFEFDLNRSYMGGKSARLLRSVIGRPTRPPRQISDDDVQEP